MESSAAGVAALALFVLWLGFWVPHRLRLRQQLADSRVDDRFSAGLRVLAVADGASAGSGPRGAEPGPAFSTDGSVPLLAPGSSSVDAGPVDAGEDFTARDDAPPDDVAPDDAGEERPMGHDEHRRSRQQRASRLAMLERRAARARRRLLLTLLLVLATAATWALVATGTLLWYAAAVPSGLLLLVLVLGRLAARAARRSDARWLAERRTAQREATQARALANGGPYAPRNRARITGHAVRPSTTHTQMIPRVSVSPPTGRAGEASSSRPIVAPEPADRAHHVDVVTTAQVRREPAARVAGGGDGDREVAPAPEPAPESASKSASKSAPVREPEPVTPAPVGGEPWDPVPVPLPTYVTKPTAPRRAPHVEPDGSFTLGRNAAAAALAATMDGALGPTATPARPATERASDRPAPTSASASSASASASAAGDEPRPRTETLGLPLEQILARRRAAG